MWCITLIDLWILKNPCIPGIKPTWSWCMIFLMRCWILIAKILIKKPSWKTQTIDTPWREAPDNCLAGKSRRHQEPGWTQAGSHFRQNEDLETFPGFPSGSDGKEPACRGHRIDPRSRKIPHALGQLSLCSTATEAELQSPPATTTEPLCPRGRAPQQVKPPQWEASVLQLERSPCSPQGRKAHEAKKK